MEATIEINQAHLRPAVPSDFKIENIWRCGNTVRREVLTKDGQEYFLKSQATGDLEHQVINRYTNWNVLRAYLSEGLVFVKK